MVIGWGDDGFVGAVDIEIVDLFSSVLLCVRVTTTTLLQSRCSMTSAYFKSLLIYWIYEVIGHYAWGIAFPFNIWPVALLFVRGCSGVLYGRRNRGWCFGGKFISEKYSISWLLYWSTNNGVA